MGTVERIIWDAWGLLSFIFLIVYLRWVGTPHDQKTEEPQKVPKGRERKAAND
jgi:hypothetical protein